MRLKSIVKVMNFHALLRVEKSRQKADIYSKLTDNIEEMIDIISNNRNFILDKKINLVDESAPELNIYIGSDIGFCGSVNSLVNKAITEELENVDKVIIGKKVKKGDFLISLDKEEFNDKYNEIYNLIEESINEKRYSKINVLYNHYYDITSIKMIKRQIFPIEEKPNKEEYTGDFEVEGNGELILKNLIISYINYMIKIAYVSSLASENISRQNMTTESLKRIDEVMEAEKYQESKKRAEKSFRKTVDSYVTRRTVEENQ